MYSNTEGIFSLRKFKFKWKWEVNNFCKIILKIVSNYTFLGFIFLKKSSWQQIFLNSVELLKKELIYYI